MSSFIDYSSSGMAAKYYWSPVLSSQQLGVDENSVSNSLTLVFEAESSTELN